MSIAKLLPSSALRDKLPTACVISLAVVAHFLPVYEIPSDDYVFMTGWNLPGNIVWFYECFARDAWHGAPLERYRWFAFVGFLSGPLLILGVAMLLVGSRVHPRVTGFLSAFAGMSALGCLIAFLFIDETKEWRLFSGFYVWLAALVTLTVAGFCRVRPSRPPIVLNEAAALQITDST
jgi:hypothetical protein